MRSVDGDQMGAADESGAAGDCWDTDVRMRSVRALIVIPSCATRRAPRNLTYMWRAAVTHACTSPPLSTQGVQALSIRDGITASRPIARLLPFPLPPAPRPASCAGNSGEPRSKQQQCRWLGRHRGMNREYQVVEVPVGERIGRPSERAVFHTEYRPLVARRRVRYRGGPVVQVHRSVAAEQVELVGPTGIPRRQRTGVEEVASVDARREENL